MSGRDDEEALDAPVDLAAVQADDALLNMLGSGTESAPDSTDAELARILLAWRREVDSEPFGELVDPDTATTVLAAARRPVRRRHPVLGPFAAAAAVLVIAFSGVGLVAKSAEPGDQLWGLTKILYTDYARSMEATERVKAALALAKRELEQGRPDEAQKSINSIGGQLSQINNAEDRTQLAAEYQAMMSRVHQSGGGKVEDNPPGTAAEPPATPSSPVPVPPVDPSEPASPTSSTPPTTSTVPTTSSTPPTSTTPTEGEPRSSEPTPRTSEANATTMSGTATSGTATSGTATSGTATSQPAS